MYTALSYTHIYVYSDDTGYAEQLAAHPLSRDQPVSVLMYMYMKVSEVGP